MKITSENIRDLDQAIKAACPVDGIDSNGRIYFRADATPGQRAAAQQLMDDFIAAPEVA